MQNTFQETTETTEILPVRKMRKKTFFIKTKHERESASPMKMAIAAAAFMVVALSLSWMSNGLFLKELAISGSIILMVVILRVMDKPSREVGSRYHQNNLN